MQGSPDEAMATLRTFYSVFSRAPYKALQEALVKIGAECAPTPVEYDVDAVILDIEGTITPFPFVATTLFPYASARMGDYVTAHFNDEAVKSLVPEIASDAAANVADGAPVFDAATATADQVTAALLWSMSKDRKFTPLKALQGLIWEAGYVSGDLVGDLFDDVGARLRHWHESGVKIYIYSSGSVHAQKLLLGNSVAGDLTKIIDGYFDTTTGPKMEAASYTAIATAVAGDLGASTVDPARMLFLTDIPAESDSAVAAGMQTLLTIRRDNKPLAVGVDGGVLRAHRAVESLDEIVILTKKA